MNQTRLPSLDDELIREAATRTAPPEDIRSLRRELADAVRDTRQRGQRFVRWPWTPAYPALPPTIGQLRFRAILIIVAFALLLGLSIAVVGSSIRLQPLPGPIGLARPGLIAFDAGGDIFVSNPDGTGRRPLTSGPSTDVEPKWSRDGMKIGYLSMPASATTVEIHVMNADGSHDITIATTAAIVPPEGEPYIGSTRISWSGDGRFLAYTGQIDGTTRLLAARTDGGGSTPIGDPTLEGQDPTWSPDGGQIAFRGGRFDEDRGIYVMNADGSHLRRLTKADPGSVYSYFQPTWSPDSRAIAYAKWVRDSLWQLWVVRVDDRVEKAISDASSDNEWPVWSPDGSQIAYIRYAVDGSEGHFVVTDAQGADERRLTQPVFGAPVWSPDGLKLFGRVDGGDFLFSNTKHGLTRAWREHGAAPHTVAVIDVASDGSVVLPIVETNELRGSDLQGNGSWQGLEP
jgi:TolB protein